ncbi:hypothetical protein MMC20_002745 [Loxospora ochrophaea]|nr:hypothetical protein [Loxospora ochrophaea]
MPTEASDVSLVICCTASRRVKGTEASEDGYIQGAGDDSEGWSHGLSPDVCWKYIERLMATPGDDLPDLIEDLLGAEKTERDTIEATLVSPTTMVYIGRLDACTKPSLLDFDCIIECSENRSREEKSANDSKTRLQLHCGSGKLASRALRSLLPEACAFIEAATFRGCPKMLFACPTGRDLSVGIVLAALCLYFDDDGIFHPEPRSEGISKAYIRQRLSWIMVSRPSANPSRSSLQAVNSFLMQRPTTVEGPRPG